MSKKLIVKGVGKFMAQLPDGTSVANCGTLNNLKIDLTTEIEDIYGGDGLFSIDTLVKNKMIEITATDAKFDLDLVRLMTGGNLIAGSIWDQPDYIDYNYNWILGEKRLISLTGSTEKTIMKVLTGSSDEGNVTVTLNGSGNIVPLEAGQTATSVASTIATTIDALAGYRSYSIGTTVIIEAVVAGNQTNTTFTDTDTTGVTTSVEIVEGTSSGAASITTRNPIFSNQYVTVRLEEDNSSLTRITSGNPTSTQYLVSGDIIQFNAALAGKTVSVSYKCEALPDLEAVELKVCDVPFTVGIVHVGTFEQKDNNRRGLETELFACRAKGAFSIDTTRRTASTSTVTLGLIDPERIDDRVGFIKTFSLGGTGCY